MNLIETRNVSKNYGKVQALKNVDLDVAKGESLGVLGPNGAGKSTWLNLVSGVRQPTVGTIKLNGRDPRHPQARRSLGVTPQDTGLKETLKVSELYDFVTAHFSRRVPMDELLTKFQIADLADRKTGGLSGGQKRRVALALAFAADLEIVLLDEPSTGLDEHARESLWQAIAEFHEAGRTLIITSHYLEEIEALAKRVVVFDEGEVIADGSIDEIRSLVQVSHVSFVHAHAHDIVQHLQTWPGIESIAAEGHSVRASVTNSDALVRQLVTSGVQFERLHIQPANLSDAFKLLTKKSV